LRSLGPRRGRLPVATFRPAGPSGTAAIAIPAPVLARRRRTGLAAREPPAGSSDCTPRRAGARTPASTSSRATTGSRCAISSATTRSTTRPTRGSRDGESHNLSWNCGAEGETHDPAILALRARQTRNFLATLLLSQGVPMLTPATRSAAPARQQQRLLPGQRDQLARLGPDPSRPAARLHAAPDQLPRHAPVLRRRTSFRARGIRGEDVTDILWLDPDARR